jgi:hypothetical protein
MLDAGEREGSVVPLAGWKETEGVRLWSEREE